MVQGAGQRRPRRNESATELKLTTTSLLASLACCLLLATSACPCDANENENESQIARGQIETVVEEVPEEELARGPLTGSYNEGEPQTYGVIVDCGSSGTRAHIYQWDTKLDYPELLQDIAPMRQGSEPVSRRFNPGLSSLADKTKAEAEQYIKRVADFVHETIPKDRHGNTAIYILATAGMRLLDEATQDRIMGEIGDFVRENYDFADVKTSVIPGSYEGMYQWISVNAKAKRFLGDHTSGRTKTYAVIEMGGASVQVTYQLRPGVSNIIASTLPADLRKAYLAQQVEPAISRHDDPENTYLLHSTTFLGFGGNSAREAYLDLLIKKHYSRDYMQKFLGWSRHLFSKLNCLKPNFSGVDGDTDNHQVAEVGQKKRTPKSKPEKRRKGEILTVKDPCAPKGFVTDEIKKPQRMLEVRNQTIGFIAEDDEPTFPLRVQGTGQYNKCKKYVVEMLELAKKERLNCKQDGSDQDTCTMSLIGESFIPFYYLDILGISEIYYTMNTMIEMPGLYHHDLVVAKTREICQTPYEKLKQKYPRVLDNPKLADRIDSECFKAVWVDTFLTEGLRMPTNFGMFKTVGKINGDDLEWTLGAVLDKSLAIEEATEPDEDEEQSDDHEERTTASPQADSEEQPDESEGAIDI